MAKSIQDFIDEQKNTVVVEEKVKAEEVIQVEESPKVEEVTKSQDVDGYTTNTVIE